MALPTCLIGSLPKGGPQNKPLIRGGCDELEVVKGPRGDGSDWIAEPLGGRNKPIPKELRWSACGGSETPEGLGWRSRRGRRATFVPAVSRG